MVIRRCKLRVGTPTGKGDSRAGAGGKKDDNSSWITHPLAKKKSDQINNTPQGAKDEEGQNSKKLISDNEESVGEQSKKETEQAGPIVDLESMSVSMKKRSPQTQTPKLKLKKDKKKWEDSTKKHIRLQGRR